MRFVPAPLEFVVSIGASILTMIEDFNFNNIYTHPPRVLISCHTEG